MSHVVAGTLAVPDVLCYLILGLHSVQVAPAVKETPITVTVPPVVAAFMMVMVAAAAVMVHAIRGV